MSHIDTSKEKTADLAKKVSEQAADIQSASSEHVKKHFTRRLGRIEGVKRFVAGWLLLVTSVIALSVVTLVQIYAASHVDRSAAGGVYTEGMVGTVNNLNPLFSAGVLDESTSRLLFNGLLRYDTEGNLVPDLASTWKVNDDRRTYVVDLRKDVKWHDGQPLTAADVVFTIKAIQNPATRSSQFASWQGITVVAPSKYQVTFTLPATLAAFPGSLTVPILPEHLLGELDPEMIRTADYNTNPIGTGPFVMRVLRKTGDQQQLELNQNEAYFRGEPKLDRFIIQTFKDDSSMKQALSEREITAAVGLNAVTSDDLLSDKSIRVQNTPLYSGVYAFFKTTNPVLSDVKVRSALATAVDRQAVLKLFNAQYPPLKTPLLPTQLGFNAAYSQVTSVADASRLLDEAGWVKQADGIRSKGGAPLELRLVTVDSPDQVRLTNELQKQWAKVGVSIQPQLLSAEQLRQNALATHDYDILLYGISIDHDPDVYAYWHSSQARPGANNFSEWKSPRADISLEVARTRLEPVLRSARYQTFQDEWQKSAPAVALYQLQTTYAFHQNATGFVSVASTNASDRLTNVEDWTVNTQSVLKTP